MLSKFLNKRLGVYKTVYWGLYQPQAKVFGLIPPSQYDVPFPKRLNLGYALRHYWELWPLLIATVSSLSIMTFHIIWAFRNKVDTQFKPYSQDCISRTMDLRNPTVHKMFIIDQKYEPWPEMADVLDRMRDAEKRALARAQGCSHP